MNSKTFRMRKQVSFLEPDYYKHHAWEHLKHEVGFKLYSLLEQEKNPVVVEINERIISPPKMAAFEDWTIYNNYGDTLEVEVLLTPVRYGNVEMIKESPIKWEIPIVAHKFTDRLHWFLTGRLP